MECVMASWWTMIENDYTGKEGHMLLNVTKTGKNSADTPLLSFDSQFMWLQSGLRVTKLNMHLFAWGSDIEQLILQIFPPWYQAWFASCRNFATLHSSWIILFPWVLRHHSTMQHERQRVSSTVQFTETWRRPNETFCKLIGRNNSAVAEMREVG